MVHLMACCGTLYGFDVGAVPPVYFYKNLGLCKFVIAHMMNTMCPVV